MKKYNYLLEFDKIVEETFKKNCDCEVEQEGMKDLLKDRIEEIYKAIYQGDE
jgi:hypothetical protein